MKGYFVGASVFSSTGWESMQTQRFISSHAMCKN